MNEISGKVISASYPVMGCRATIIPDKVDVSKIKEGDEVWVKVAFTSRHDFPEIVAHFPKQESKPVELPEEVKEGECLTNTLNQLIRYLKDSK